MTVIFREGSKKSVVRISGRTFYNCGNFASRIASSRADLTANAPLMDTVLISKIIFVFCARDGRVRRSAKNRFISGF